LSTGWLAGNPLNATVRGMFALTTVAGSRAK
jgi:hypothetical protein